MKENKSVIIWLFSGCFLIFTMVLIGGITRLTDSGLSMTTWKLLGGAPPLNLTEWIAAFDLYKASPEGKTRHDCNEIFRYVWSQCSACDASHDMIRPSAFSL